MNSYNPCAPLSEYAVCSLQMHWSAPLHLARFKMFAKTLYRRGAGWGGGTVEQTNPIFTGTRYHIMSRIVILYSPTKPDEQPPPIMSLTFYPSFASRSKLHNNVSSCSLFCCWYCFAEPQTWTMICCALNCIALRGAPPSCSWPYWLANFGGSAAGEQPRKNWKNRDLHNRKAV